MTSWAADKDPGVIPTLHQSVLKRGTQASRQEMNIGVPRMIPANSSPAQIYNEKGVGCKRVMIWWRARLGPLKPWKWKWTLLIMIHWLLTHGGKEGLHLFPSSSLLAFFFFSFLFLHQPTYDQNLLNLLSGHHFVGNYISYRTKIPDEQFSWILLDL